MEKAYGASVYVSYARADEERLGVVASLYQAYKTDWVSLKVDKDVLKPRESFEDFIEELGKADSIIVLFSNAYFESFYCMLELTRITEFGHAKERVFPVFLDNFRLDSKNRPFKNFWQEKLKKWRMPYEKSEYAEEYGSETECKAIVDSYDEIYNSFACYKDFNLGDLSTENFKTTIQWSKGRYLLSCKNNPAFKESIEHLSASTNDVKTALKKQINDKSIGLSDENIVAWLVQNHPSDFLSVIAKVQLAVASLQDKQFLARLLKLLLPLLFDPSYVPLFKAERESIKIIQIPYATYVSAEVLMASSDNREIDLYVNKVSEESREVNSIPGYYHLAAPPEGGENTEQTFQQDSNQHLSSLLGHPGGVPSFLDVEDILFDRYARKLPGKSYSQNMKWQLINIELAKLDAHFYWIMPLDTNQAWVDFAKELIESHSEIVVLQLDNTDEKEIEENMLFAPLHKVISH